MKEDKEKLNEVIRPSEGLIMPAKDVLSTSFIGPSGATLAWLEMMEEEKKEKEIK